MRKLSQVLAIVLAFSVSGLAQTQIATVMSGGPFQLRGANVNPAAGVPSWPIMSGDTVQAGAMTLTLTFPDGSTVVLAPHTLATITLVGGIPVVTLHSNTAHYDLKTSAAVTLQCMNGTAAPNGPVGNIQCGGSPLPAGWWIAGAVAGGVGLAVVLANHNGSSVSPSR